MDTTRIHTTYYKRRFILGHQTDHDSRPKATAQSNKRIKAVLRMWSPKIAIGFTDLERRTSNREDKNCGTYAKFALPRCSRLGTISDVSSLTLPAASGRHDKDENATALTEVRDQLTEESQPNNIRLELSKGESKERERVQERIRSEEPNVAPTYMTYVWQNNLFKIRDIDDLRIARLHNPGLATAVTSDIPEPLKTAQKVWYLPAYASRIESTEHRTNFSKIDGRTRLTEGTPFDNNMYAETDFDEDPAYMTTDLGLRCTIYDPRRGCTHPLWKYGKAIVVLMKLTPEDVRERIRISQACELPVGANSYEEVEKLGWICLKPGMAVFIRSVKSEDDRGTTADPLQDDIQGWVTNHTELIEHHIRYDDTIHDRLLAIAATALGPEEERTAVPPMDAKNPAGYSFERPRAMAHPCRNMKYNNNLSTNEDFRKELLHAATEYAGLAMDLAPKERINLIENIGTVKQTLPLGHRNNRNFWTGFQANH
ncbi:hypothetical protein OE88DRAFT_1643256 [Heliocybe sulcata]|uniref:Uncharacterized protein n=1 Tax=Heliocybe sulcata TaxID=5364 RepID=A0A5C3N853_9AGAM|nr:hypothetical protein OE88DRAFT_1643256 [Heliocybe sulcata]